LAVGGSCAVSGRGTNMGAWSTGNFDNDDALDWLDDLCESNEQGAIRAALQVVVDWPENENLEAIDCCCALAAAAMIAAAPGQPADDIPEEAEEWIDRNGPEVRPDEITLAKNAIRRIRTNSELRQLWEEADALEEWMDAVQDLENRLP